MILGKQAHYFYGLYAKKLNEPLNAQRDFKKVIELDTIIESSGNIRHYAYFELGQNENAKEWINKIIKELQHEDVPCIIDREVLLENLEKTFVVTLIRRGLKLKIILERLDLNL